MKVDHLVVVFGREDEESDDTVAGVGGNAKGSFPLLEMVEERRTEPISGSRVGVSHPGALI